PSYPGACTTKNGGGVQLLFGNRASMNWGGGHGWVEICGSYDPPDEYGMAIYGLYPGVVAPPATMRSGGLRPYSPSQFAFDGNNSVVNAYGGETFGTDSVNTAKVGDNPATTA